MKKLLEKTTSLLVLTIIPFLLYAPPVPPPGNGNGPNAPIDNFIELLLLLGLSLGVYMIVKKLRSKDII